MKINKALLALVALLGALTHAGIDRIVRDFKTVAEALPNGDLAVSMIEAEHASYNRGQSNLVQLFLGIAIAFIVGIGVAVPILNDVIADTTFENGMTETVVGYVPLFLGLLLLVAVAAPIMRRV